jgi:S1-C subfamily serine protease
MMFEQRRKNMRNDFLNKLNKFFFTSFLLISCSCSNVSGERIPVEGKGVFLSNGFFINHEGYIATTSHSVSEKCKNIWIHIKDKNYQIDQKDIEFNDSLSDFAIIRSKLKTINPLVLSKYNRTAVYTLSYPPSLLINSPDKHLVIEIDSDPINLGTGRKVDVVKRIKTKTQRGMSGSPVLNEKNEVVGMIIRGVFNVDDMEASEVAMMIPVDSLVEFLKRAEISPALENPSVNRDIEPGLVQIICDPGM